MSMGICFLTILCLLVKKHKSASVYKTKSVWHVKNDGNSIGDKSVTVKNDRLVDIYPSLNPINHG